MVSCSEKTLIAASMIFGGLTFLLPSLVTTWTYLRKWIPTETDPVLQQEMKNVLLASGVLAIVVVAGGVYYLKREKCV